MPIECYLQPIDGGDYTRFDSVEPGHARVFVDYAADAGRLILAYCHQHDLGGQVHEMDREEFEAKMEEAEDGLVDFEEDTVIAELSFNETFSLEVIDENGEMSELVLSHNLPLTVSMN